MLSRFSYLESNYILNLEWIGFLTATFEERWTWCDNLQFAELEANSELALVLSDFLRDLRYLRLLCQVDIRSEEKLIFMLFDGNYQVVSLFANA